MKNIFYVFLLCTGLFAFQACHNSNDSTQKDAGDLNENENGNSEDQSHGYGTSNGYPNDTFDMNGDTIDHTENDHQQ
jgi:hypothetical protein